MTIWSKWLRGESSRSEEGSTEPLSLTVGEVVDRTKKPSQYVPVQRCLLCEAGAAVEMGESEVQIRCATCGQYSASVDAAHALNALVKYREPALAKIRMMLGAYRQGQAGRMPRIRVQYVVSEGVPTFCLTSDPPYTFSHR